MRKLANLLFFICLLFFIGYLYENTSRSELASLWYNIQYRFFAPAPCTEPLAYKLGTFDDRFNISQKYFLNALVEAEAVWEKAYDKDLFIYAPDNEADILKINLIYDYRQEATSKLADLGIVVKDTQESYNNLKTRFETLKLQYYSRQASFEKELADFNREKKIYEEQVIYWNSRGGAPKKEFDNLQQTRLALEQQAKNLQNTQNVLNKMVEEINSLVAALNRVAGNLNLNVAQYNTIGASRGETFEEGVYREEGYKREIDIYEFSNKTKLVRVLAHELGHALGIEHLEDPKAIMYRLNQDNAETPTEADLNALRAICNSKN